jgi:hypothetical protein
MGLRDADLLSVQEARTLAAKAKAAQQVLAGFSQEQVDRIVAAAAEAARGDAERLARLAHEETGFGNVPDKTRKNLFAAVDVHEYIRPLRTVGILREDPVRRVVEIAEPMGVVAAVIPSTNPTSTAICKALISLKARDAVVMSPHPSAKGCIQEAARVMHGPAVAAGMPPDALSCMTEVSLEGTQELMRCRDIGVILATGGIGLVRAAYSSGKPAYGVGPGNVPAYIEKGRRADGGPPRDRREDVRQRHAVLVRAVARVRRADRGRRAGRGREERRVLPERRGGRGGRARGGHAPAPGEPGDRRPAGPVHRREGGNPGPPGDTGAGGSADGRGP